MSKQNLEKILVRELQVLNDQIDEKIIKGLSYAREAKRHKFILNSLASIKRNSRQSWFTKTLRPFSFI